MIDLDTFLNRPAVWYYTVTAALYDQDLYDHWCSFTSLEATEHKVCPRHFGQKSLLTLYGQTIDWYVTILRENAVARKSSLIRKCVCGLIYQDSLIFSCEFFLGLIQLTKIVLN